MKRPRSLSLFRDVTGEGDEPETPAPPTTEAAPAEEPPAPRRGLFGRRREAAEVAAPEAEADAQDADGEARPRRRLFGRRQRAASQVEAGAVDAMDVAAGIATLAADADPVDFEIDDQGRLVENGRKRYAIGLLWLPFDVDRKIAEQAGEAGFGDDAPDLYAMVGDREQIGFGFKYNGLKPGMAAAATLFSDEVLPGNWLAAFEMSGDMGQSWWIVAWRDGQIYEDRVITDGGDAQGAFAALQDAPNWSAMICPVAWDIDGTIDADLGSILQKRGRPARLKSTNQLRALLPIAIPVVLLVVAAIAGYLVWQNIVEQRRLEELRRIEAERRAAAARAAQAAQQPVEIIPPWVGLPSTERFYEICARSFQELLIFPTGWRQQPMTCSVSGDSIVAQATWRRESGGRVSWFLATMEDAGFENIGLDSNLDGATIPLREPFGEGDMDKSLRALSAQEVSETLTLRFDTLDLSPGFRLVAPRPDQAREQEGQPIWSYHELTFRESTPLQEYLKLVSDIPARVPEQLTYDPYNQTWTMVMRVYHEARQDE
jgi:hypothetical protein